MKQTNLFIFIMLLFISCEGDIYTEASFEISVEGYIEQGKSPYISIMHTIPARTEYESFDSLSKYVIRDAVVKITVDDKVHQLEGINTGDPTNPYYYTSQELIGETGKEYSLDIYCMNKHLSATTSIPIPISLLSLTPKQTENDPNIYTLNACFVDNRDTKDYYKTFTLSQDNYHLFLSSFMGNFDDINFANDTVNVAVLKGETVYNDNFTPLFAKGESVTIKFCHIERNAYHYWNEYEKVLYFSRNPVFSMRMNLPSNIKGGLGYWFGYGTTYYDIIIQ